VPETSRRAALALGIAIFALSFLIRITNLGTAFVDGKAQVPPYDDLYHAKRIVYSALRFPNVLDFDSNRGPSGAFCPWPPLYDLGAGGLSRVLGARDSGAVLARVVWLPPLTLSLTAGLFAAAVGRRLGVLGGALAGVLVALSFPLVVVSRLGSIDHHFLEPLLLLAILAAFLRVSRAVPGADSLREGLLFGAALGTALLVQTAFLFTAAVAFAAAFLLFGSALHRLRAAALGFAIAAAVVATYRATRPAGYPESEWFLGTPHAAALGAAAVATLVLPALRDRGCGPVLSRALALALAAACAAAVPGAAAAFGEGARFFGGDPWLSTIQEFRPLFLDRPADPLGDLMRAGGGLFLAVPFAVVVLRRAETGARVVGLFTLSYLAAALSSRRFLAAAVPLLAVAAADVVVELRGSGRMLSAWLLALVALGPTGAAAWLWLRRPGPVVPPGAVPMQRVAARLAASNEKPGRVLGPWSWGHLFDVRAGRGVIVDNFGAAVGRSTFDNALGAVLLTREERVADYCKATGVRFVVLENPLRLLPPQVESLGGDVSAYLRPGPGPDAPAAVTRLAQTTFWWRAYFDHGAPRPEAGNGGKAFRRFRLVYEDARPSADPPPYRGPAAQVWELEAR
jgi:hypothetical protein